MSLDLQMKTENKTVHIFIKFRNSSLEIKNTKRSLIYGTKSYKNIHCGSLGERGATWCLYLSAGGAGVLSSLLSLRRWVEVLPDSNLFNCKCIISQCGWKWEFLTILGQKDLYNFTLSGQPAAKVSMKTDTNMSRKYYLVRKIADQIFISLKYQQIFQCNNIRLTQSQKRLPCYLIAFSC